MLAFLLAPPGPLEGQAPSAESPPPTVRTLSVPVNDLGATFLPRRQAEQIRAAESLTILNDFSYQDRIENSGIDFVNRVVDNAARDHMLVHYDHGNGLAVADVDGDQRLDLYFVTQIGSNALYRNLGDGKFENITERAGVGLEDRIGVTAAFADVDNDGDADLFVTTVRNGNVLLLNNGTGGFTDATTASGLGYSGHSSGATFFDFDLDGDLDLYLSNVGRYTTDELGPDGAYRGIDKAFDGHLKPERNEASILYRNEDGKFVDVTEATGLADRTWSGDATFTDINRDGYPDLYVLNMQGDDRLYLNRDGKSFDEATARYFEKTPWGTMGVRFFDADNDGFPDLLLTDMHSDMVQIVEPGAEKLKAFMTWTEEYLDDGTNNIFGNAFFKGDAEGPFAEVSDVTGAENFWPWGLSTGDLNADGFEDVFIAASMNYPFRYGINSVLLNDSGARFVDSEFVLGVEPRQGDQTRIEWFRLDCSTADRSHALCTGQEGTVIVEGALGTRSSALVDLDADGDLDIVTNEFGSRPQLLLSNLAERHSPNWLAIELVGSRSNRDGLGAWIHVHAGDRSLVRYVDGKSGYLTQSRVPTYIGLGDVEKVDRIEVVWPSGLTQTVGEGIAINALHVVREPEN